MEKEKLWKVKLTEEEELFLRSRFSEYAASGWHVSLSFQDSGLKYRKPYIAYVIRQKGDSWSGTSEYAGRVPIIDRSLKFSDCEPERWYELQHDDNALLGTMALKPTSHRLRDK